MATCAGITTDLAARKKWVGANMDGETHSWRTYGPYDTKEDAIIARGRLKSLYTAELEDIDDDVAKEGEKWWAYNYDY